MTTPTKPTAQIVQLHKPSRSLEDAVPVSGPSKRKPEHLPSVGTKARSAYRWQSGIKQMDPMHSLCAQAVQESGLSYKQIELRGGPSATTISSIVNGKTGRSLRSTYRDIFRALGLEMNTLIQRAVANGHYRTVYQLRDTATTTRKVR